MQKFRLPILFHIHIVICGSAVTDDAAGSDKLLGISSLERYEHTCGEVEDIVGSVGAYCQLSVGRIKRGGAGLLVYHRVNGNIQWELLVAENIVVLSHILVIGADFKAEVCGVSDRIRGY